MLLKRALHAAPHLDALDTLRSLFKVFMDALDIKMVFGLTEVRGLLWRMALPHPCQGEPHMISMEFVVKLNENAFRPLFRRMQDWTFVDKKGTVRCWRWRGCS